MKTFGRPVYLLRSHNMLQNRANILDSIVLARVQETTGFRDWLLERTGPITHIRREVLP